MRGDVDPLFTGMVTISLGMNSGDAARGGDDSVAAVQGVATFSGPEIFFNTGLNPASAQSSANYRVTQLAKKSRKTRKAGRLDRGI